MISASSKQGGWVLSRLGSFAPQAERLVSINAVLNSLPVYAMSAFKLPPSVIEEIDKRRRAFLCTGEDVCSRARCLVAWDVVCSPKELGGIGVKNLKVQNEALLLKRLFSLFSSESSWANWIWKEFDGQSLLKSLPLGQHWTSLQKFLPELQKLMTVKIGNGSRTSLWHDCWLGILQLANLFPALYSHTTDCHATVKDVLSRGLMIMFVPRLSEAANAELHSLQAMVADLTLTNDNDVWQNNRSTSLTTKEIYDARFPVQMPSPNWKIIWNCRAPLKVKLFAWLLVRNRLSTRMNLSKKKIVQSASCAICSSGDETANHLFLTCPFAINFWSKVRIQPAIQDVQLFHRLSNSPLLPSKHLHVFYILCFWALWNHRHDVVFRGQQPSLAACLHRAISEATLWAETLAVQDRHVIDVWKHLFSSALQTLNLL